MLEQVLQPLLHCKVWIVDERADLRPDLDLAPSNALSWRGQSAVSGQGSSAGSAR